MYFIKMYILADYALTFCILRLISSKCIYLQKRHHYVDINDYAFIIWFSISVNALKWEKIIYSNTWFVLFTLSFICLLVCSILKLRRICAEFLYFSVLALWTPECAWHQINRFNLTTVCCACPKPVLEISNPHVVVFFVFNDFEVKANRLFYWWNCQHKLFKHFLFIFDWLGGFFVECQ